MTRVTLVLALGLVILTVPQTKLGIVRNAVAADGKAEAARFQGVWHFDSFVGSGTPLAKQDREKQTVKFDEDRFTVRKDGAFTDAGTWKLDAGKKPKEITLVYTEGDRTGLTLYAIFRWDDEDLVLCYGSPRPDKFESNAQNKNTLIRFSKLKVAEFTSAAHGKAEAAKYQGVWRYDSFVEGGKNWTKEACEKHTIKFDEDRFTLRKDGRFDGAGRWKLDAGKKPNQITLVFTEGNSTGPPLHGIYRWDDEDLVMCLGDPSPGNFESDSKNNNKLIRVSKLKK